VTRAPRLGATAAADRLGGELIVVCAPTGRDAPLIREMLTRAGCAAEVAPSMETVCEQMRNGAAVAILAEEALTPRATALLLDAIRRQPSWSDFPIIVLSSALAMARQEQLTLRALRQEGNVTLVERPVHSLTLLTAVQSAFRARRRQYEVRDYLAERARVEEQVRQAQKMDAVGQLAGGLAHEVNNMMTVVIGFGDLVLKRKDLDGTTRAEIEEMVKAGKRSASITQQLLAFSRRQARRLEVLQLDRVIADMSSLVRQLVGPGIEVELAFMDPLGTVRADRNQLEQVLVNLAANARDAMPEGGSLRISAESVAVDEALAEALNAPDAVGSRYMLMRVQDTGHGIEASTLNRIFEPFFTTKPVGKGTGLGLSTVYGIVHQNNGHIIVESAPGVGTEFRIYLPEVEEGANATEQPTSPPASGVETVLLVEDEPAVLDLARRALIDQGYAVIDVPSGDAAFARLAGDRRGVDLVVCDVAMPGMSGPEFVRRLHQVFPGTPVLFISGYPGEDLVDRGLDRFAPFLQKPFTAEQLAREVRRLIDAQKEQTDKKGLAGATISPYSH
jgi:signal transduction histidine kinase/ActR/RegA family two-component response regulator